jgi:hypothetical protein
MKTSSIEMAQLHEIIDNMSFPTLEFARFLKPAAPEELGRDPYQTDDEEDKAHSLATSDLLDAVNLFRRGSTNGRV